MRFLIQSIFAATALSAFAGEWPAGPVRMIVPYPAGGPSDIGARLVSQKIAERVKQNVIVENRPGAAGNIGTEAASKAAPDGYTFLYAITGFVINPATYKLNWDPVRDFAPVSQVSSASFVLVSSLAFAPKSVAELIALGRAKPREITCAHSGSLPQIGCELLRLLARIDITTVQYRGSAPALNDVSAGQVNLVFDVPISAAPAVRGGRVRALATTNARRGIGPFGDLPTMDETLPGFEIDGWHGIFAPARTPREIVLRLNQEVRGILSEDEMRRRFTVAGMEVAPNSPEEFGALVIRDLVKYAKIVREADIKAD